MKNAFIYEAKLGIVSPVLHLTPNRCFGVVEFGYLLLTIPGMFGLSGNFGE